MTMAPHRLRRLSSNRRRRSPRGAPQGLISKPLGPQVFGPALYAGMFAGLALGDLRMFLHRPTESKVWVKRHLLRMLLAFAFAVRALFSIGVDIGLPFEVAVTAPILLALLAAVWWRRRVDGRGTDSAPAAAMVSPS